MRMKERRRYLAAKTKWNQTDTEMRRIKDSNEQAVHQEAKQMSRARRRDEEYKLHKQVLGKKKSDEQDRTVSGHRLGVCAQRNPLPPHDDRISNNSASASRRLIKPRPARSLRTSASNRRWMTK